MQKEVEGQIGGRQGGPGGAATQKSISSPPAIDGTATLP
jgi:hypothetical protein